MRIMRIVLIGLGIVLVAGILYLFVLYLDSDEESTAQLSPQLELAQMRVTNFSVGRVDMNMNVNIKNPTAVSLHVDSLYYTVMIEGQEVASTIYPGPLHIQAGQDTRVSFPFTVYYSRLQSLDQLEEEGRDTVLYTLNAVLFTDAELLPDDQFNLQLTERRPLPRVPEIKVADMNMEDPDNSGAVMQVKTYVVNENMFALELENMDYSLRVGDHQAMEGQKPESIRIAAKDTAFIQVPVELSSGKLAGKLQDDIRQGSDQAYFFSLNAKLLSDADMLEESELAMTTTGRLEELGGVDEEHVIEE
jgi:LEA14-like dessication related protein